MSEHVSIGFDRLQFSKLLASCHGVHFHMLNLLTQIGLL